MYSKLIEDLILEGMCTLMEQQVTVKMLQRDKEIVKEVLSNCEKRFEKESLKKLN